jgi:TolA-binding protein
VERPASPPPALDGEGEQDADLLLYRAAHRRHFQDKDPERALAAWDAYLAAFPTGRLAVEARFNRALCLVKVGRIAEAEASLQEIASGIFGTYRSARAAELLDAVRRRRASPAK